MDYFMEYGLPVTPSGLPPKEWGKTPQIYPRESPLFGVLNPSLRGFPGMNSLSKRSKERRTERSFSPGQGPGKFPAGTKKFGLPEPQLK